MRRFQGAATFGPLSARSGLYHQLVRGRKSESDPIETYASQARHRRSDGALIDHKSGWRADVVSPILVDPSASRGVGSHRKLELATSRIRGVEGPTGGVRPTPRCSQ